MNLKIFINRLLKWDILITLFIGTVFLVQCKDIIGSIVPDGDKILTGIEAIDKLSDVYEAYNREFTPKEEYYIGRTVAASLLQKNNLYGDGSSKLEKYVTQVGQTVAMASERPETYQGYRFIVVRSPSINAFAVPSGYIFITTGLIKTASSEDELAGVLAHEVSHVVLKHPLASISEAQKNEAVTNLVKFGAGKALSREQAIGNLTGIFGGIVDEVSKSVLSGYDSEKEKEADIASVQLLVNAGYNPKGLSTMLRKLKKGGGVHGDPNVRASDVDQKISTFEGKIPTLVAVRTKRFKVAVDQGNLAFNP